MDQPATKQPEGVIEGNLPDSHHNDLSNPPGAAPTAGAPIPELSGAPPDAAEPVPPASVGTCVQEESVKEMAGNADKSVMSVLQAQNESVVGHLERLEGQLTDHLRATSSCSRAAFDRLYDEMQAYKKNFLLEAQRPLLQDLMMLYDSIDKLARNYERGSAVDPATLFQNLDALRVEAEEVLMRVGVERMMYTSEKLDVNLQRAVKTVATESPAENLMVVEQVRSGFLMGGQPFRKEQVVVKKYAQREQAGSPASPETKEPPGS